MLLYFLEARAFYHFSARAGTRNPKTRLHCFIRTRRESHHTLNGAPYARASAKDVTIYNHSLVE